MSVRAVKKSFTKKPAKATDNASRVISGAIFKWYDQHGRKDLPWQKKRQAYRVWISEVMLQQTQVKTVIPYFEAFMKRFPNVLTLANAHEDTVLHHWSGLGYYARARNLHKAAKQVRDLHKGRFPKNFDDILALPGVGRSTAGAIMAQAYGKPYAILDGNVKRVLARYHGVEGWTGSASVQDILWHYAERHTPSERLADYTQGMMDLGAMICTRSRPSCELCPLSKSCVALATDRVSSLPTPKAKKRLPVKSVKMLLLRNKDNEILLEKRPPTGIWGGLWSLPEMSVENAQEQAIEVWCREQYQLKIKAVNELEVIRHTFSHYHLDITPCVVDVKKTAQSVMEADRRVWYKACQDDRQQPAVVKSAAKIRAKPSLGLAAPVTRLLNRIYEESI